MCIAIISFPVDDIINLKLIVFLRKQKRHDKNLNILKVQSYKSYNNKYIIASTQIRKTEIFAFIAILFFKLLSRKVLFINRKENRNC